MEARVKAWMSGDPVALRAEASALEALDLMVRRGIRHLPVVDGESRVVGVLSLDDLRAALPIAVSLRTPPSASERELARDWRVGEVMTHAPETVTSETPLAEAADRMADRRIGCLLVVDEDGRLGGILSETDALRALATTLLTGRTARGERSELDGLVDELRRERERITARLDRVHAVERELTTDAYGEPRDAAEQGADLRELRVAETLDELAARRLEAIDRALDHAAQGRLSVCDRCGGRIPIQRLRALPGTTVCVRCAGEQERGA
jgi:CBS domain-containing protein/RNA polymerase-binding transcription factor DksA